MNTWSKKLSSRRLVTSGAILLVLYLAIILTVTNLGQARLKESQERELSLKVQSYASVLEMFFSANDENITNISNGRSMQAFFANLASGMSMEYGLGASLIKLEKELNKLISDKKINKKPIYERLLLTNYEGNIIVDTGNQTPFSLNLTKFHKMDGDSICIYPSLREDGIQINLVKPVQFSGKTVGYLIAKLNEKVIIEQLTSQEYEDSRSRVDLSTSIGPVFIWDTISTDKHQTTEDELNRNLFFDVKIENTPFHLKSWFVPLAEKDFFTSRWFIVGLSFLAIPVILGLLYVFMINSVNLVLRTKVEESSRQQQILFTKNSRLIEEIEKRKISEQKLAYQASHDALTGLANRKFGNERLEQEIESASKNNSNMLVIFIDLDNFKQINDTLGHLVGDEVLVQSTQRLLSIASPKDTLSRFGGDEFLLIVPNLKDSVTGKKIAENILTLFEQSFVSNKQEFFISTSIGMAIYPQDGSNAQQLLANADTAMYKVKEDGRNAFHFYNAEMNMDVQRTLNLDSRLRQAISHEELELYYQPIINLRTQKIIGAEALMRWNDAQYGFVAPDEFIKLAERNGLIHQLGEFAVHEACVQAAKWQQYLPLQMSVNFSSVQFRYYEKLLSQIKSALKVSGLPPGRLDIEITESLLFDHSDGVLTLLDTLQEMGAQLTIDDFGTGYSALSYLQKFPFDRLKIDRSFLSNLQTNEGDRELVNAIIAMAKALNLKIVAEGIEDQWLVDYLTTMQCEFGQGFFYSKPVSAEDFEQLLKNQY
ncbi:putative bifunctional diguanylate cyclase/phosphodiesterase [Vibrio rumoiensis]|uniref:Diguanylate cyclase n=1 Tax=Vibrio rumoiensis 1S-45 TaxID=1188252 RepID=A0A1E5E470_9VIBR|nr:EAL domain-containing protein [Vibrio rumoiensis]OEF27536.1 diguanylate cyclase [Vibrio rumoiensis 1S-45]